MNLLMVMKWMVAFFYLMTALVYFRYFIYQNEKQRAPLALFMPLAILVHLFYLVSFTLQVHRLPLSNVFEVMSSYVFIFVLIYFLIERNIHDKALGTIILPIALVLQLISNSFIDFRSSPADILTRISIFKIHVITILLAYSGFAISFIASLMYVFLSREIHNKKLGFFFSRLPSLELLDRLGNMAVAVGVSFITGGILLGVYMASRVWESRWTFDPKLLSVFVTWLIYSGFLYFRNARGWQGMRASLISISGFVWVLLSFLVFTIFLSHVHSFI